MFWLYLLQLTLSIYPTMHLFEKQSKFKWLVLVIAIFPVISLTVGYFSNSLFILKTSWIAAFAQIGIYSVLSLFFSMEKNKSQTK